MKRRHNACLEVPAATLAPAILAILAAVGHAQTISFDNSCGDHLWHSGCCNFVPEISTCFCENNWNSGTVTSSDCFSGPREPGAGDDVFIGNIYVEANSSVPIRSLTTTTTFNNTYIIEVSDHALYQGPVIGYGAYGGAGQHYFAAPVTPASGMEFRWPCSAVIAAGMNINNVSFGVYTDVYNTSTVNWNGDATFFIDGAYGAGEHALFHNQPGALFLAQGDAEMRGLIGLGHFLNAGTLRKDGGLGTTQIGSEFKNAAGAIIDARTGKLRFTGDMTLAGAALISAGAELEIRGSATVPASFSVSGPGRFRLAGTLDVAAGASATLQSIDMSLISGEVGSRFGAGSMTISSSALLAGTFSGGGVTTISHACQASLFDGFIYLDTGTRLDNHGAVDWTDLSIGIAESSSVTNFADGVWNCRGNGVMSGLFFTTGSASNAGLLRKSGPGTVTQLALPFTNTGTVECLSGRLDVRDYHQTAGETVLSGGEIGAVYHEYAPHIEGGVLRGSGIIAGHLDNSGGTLSPGSPIGAISILGAVDFNQYVQGPAATLEIQISGGEQGSFDQVLIGGGPSTYASAILDGTLRVRFTNGYQPESGSWDVLLLDGFGSVSGEFSNLDLEDGMTVTYFPDRVHIELPGPFCPADFNQDGGIDGSDVESFFAAWENGDPFSDVNMDGGVDGADVQTFYAAWEAGGCF